jgi:hypothetical protein
MNKARIAGCLLLLASLIAVTGAIGHVLREKRLQMLCSCRLQHWHTTLSLYLEQQDRLGRAPSNTAEEWHTLLRSYLYTPEANDCPAVSPTPEQYSYKLNRAALHWQASRPLSRAASARTVFLFDGHSDEKAVTAILPPYSEVANRHLGGANLLLLSGAVVYIAARREHIATGEYGWHNAGGQEWE